MEYLNSIHKHKIADVMKNFLTVEKYFTESKDREIKIREEMKKLFLKQLVIFSGSKKLFYQAPIPLPRPQKVSALTT